MLYTQTVEPATLSILKKIFQLPELKDFALAGGTALALKKGHRVSIDIDLFSLKLFDNNDLISILQNHFPSFELRRSVKMGVFGFIGDLKIDCIPHFQFKMIKDFETIEGIRFYSDEDIAAMKIFAIIQRAKKKDYWDLNELLYRFSFDEIIDFYLEKYPNNTMLIPLAEAIVKYHLVDGDDDPVCLNNLTWSTVKKNINKKIDDFFKN